MSLAHLALSRVKPGAATLLPDYVCLVGGEPLDEAGLNTNLSLVRDLPNGRFLLCTGAGDGAIRN